MSVERIEKYRQQDDTDILKVFCKPTKENPVGSNYFYIDAKDEYLLNKYTWFINHNLSYGYSTEDSPRCFYTSKSNEFLADICKNFRI